MSGKRYHEAGNFIFVAPGVSASDKNDLAKPFYRVCSVSLVSRWALELQS